MVKKRRKDIEGLKSRLAKNLAGDRTDLAVPQNEEGKMAINVRLSKRDAEKLMHAFINGDLAQFKILSVAVSAPSPTSAEQEQAAQSIDLVQDIRNKTAADGPDFAGRIDKKRRSGPSKDRE